MPCSHLRSAAQLGMGLACSGNPRVEANIGRNDARLGQLCALTLDTEYGRFRRTAILWISQFIDYAGIGGPANLIISASTNYYLIEIISFLNLKRLRTGLGIILAEKASTKTPQQEHVQKNRIIQLYEKAGAARCFQDEFWRWFSGFLCWPHSGAVQTVPKARLPQ
jgi:hypothetical protein